VRALSLPPTVESGKEATSEKDDEKKIIKFRKRATTPKKESKKILLS